MVKKGRKEKRDLRKWFFYVAGGILLVMLVISYLAFADRFSGSAIGGGEPGGGEGDEPLIEEDNEPPRQGSTGDSGGGHGGDGSGDGSSPGPDGGISQNFLDLTFVGPGDVLTYKDPDVTFEILDANGDSAGSVVVSKLVQDGMSVAGQFVNWKAYVGTDDLAPGDKLRVSFISNIGYVKVNKIGEDEPAKVSIKTKKYSSNFIEFFLDDVFSVFNLGEDQSSGIVIEERGDYIIDFATQPVSITEKLVKRGKEISVKNNGPSYDNLAIITALNFGVQDTREVVVTTDDGERVSEVIGFDSNRDGVLDYIKFFVDISKGSREVYSISSLGVQKIRPGDEPFIDDIVISPPDFDEISDECRENILCGDYDVCDANSNANEVLKGDVSLSRMQGRFCFPAPLDCPPIVGQERTCEDKSVDIEVKEENEEFKEIVIYDKFFGDKVAEVKVTKIGKVDIVFSN